MIRLHVSVRHGKLPQPSPAPCFRTESFSMSEDHCMYFSSSQFHNSSLPSTSFIDLSTECIGRYISDLQINCYVNHLSFVISFPPSSDATSIPGSTICDICQSLAVPPIAAMDSRFWAVFRRAPSELEGQRYESLQAGKVPVKGNLPVEGNGPSILELYRQGKATATQSDRFRAALDNEPAPAPAVPLTRKLSMGTSTRIAKSRRKSTIPSSAKAPGKEKTGLKKSQKSSLDLRGTTQMGTTQMGPMPVLNTYNYNNFDNQPLPRIPNSFDATRHRRKSTHVDLFDAVPIKESLREEKIGRRNYGEDVADRNISMYGPEDTRTSIDSR